MKSITYDTPPVGIDTFPLGPPLKARHGQFYSSGGIPHGMPTG